MAVYISVYGLPFGSSHFLFVLFRFLILAHSSVGL